MKTNLFIFLFSLISVVGFSQETEKRAEKRAEKKKERTEKMESLRIAFLTEALDLSVEESQSFWPVYNDHAKKRKKILEGRTKMDKNVEITDNTQAAQMIDEELRIERALLDLKTDYVRDLKTVLPDTKIAKLMMASKRFKKELLDKMKGRKKGKGKRENRK